MLKEINDYREMLLRIIIGVRQWDMIGHLLKHGNIMYYIL